VNVVDVEQEAAMRAVHVIVTIRAAIVPAGLIREGQFLDQLFAGHLSAAGKASHLAPDEL